MKNLQRVVDSNFDRMQARRGLTAKNQSQMTKLIPQLQIGRSVGPTEDQEKAKLEGRISALKKLKATLVQANVKVTDLYLADKLTQLKRLTTARKTIQAVLDSKMPPGVARYVKACMNELTSLREGVYIGAATTKKSLAIIACADAVSKVDYFIESSRKKLATIKLEAAGVEYDEAENEKFLQQIQSLKKLGESKNVGAIRSRPFVVMRVPVIPFTNIAVDRNTLRNKAMIKTDLADGYTIIHNQVVVGINGNKQMMQKIPGMAPTPKKRPSTEKRKAPVRRTEEEKALQEEMRLKQKPNVDRRKELLELEKRSRTGLTDEQNEELRELLLELHKTIGLRISDKEVLKKLLDNLEIRRKREGKDLSEEEGEILDLLDIQTTQAFEDLQDRQALPTTFKYDKGTPAYHAAERILADLEKQTGKQFRFISNQPFFAASGHWFWVAPKREADVINAAIPKIKSWGFAFDLEKK